MPIINTLGSLSARAYGFGEKNRNYIKTIIGDGAAALWMLDEPSGSACYDSVAGLTATLQGSYNRAQPVPSGLTYSTAFDGSTAYAVTASTATLNAATLSLEFWFNSFRTAPNGDIIVYGTLNYLRSQFNGTINTIFSNANQLSSSAVTTNAWHHAVCVVSPTGCKTYIDGALSASNSAAYPSQSASNQIYLGYAAANSEYFQGNLAALAVYKQELTAQQVLNHYNIGK